MIQRACSKSSASHKEDSFQYKHTKKKQILNLTCKVETHGNDRCALHEQNKQIRNHNGSHQSLADSCQNEFESRRPRFLIGNPHVVAIEQVIHTGKKIAVDRTKSDRHGDSKKLGNGHLSIDARWNVHAIDLAIALFVYIYIYIYIVWKGT